MLIEGDFTNHPMVLEKRLDRGQENEESTVFAYGANVTTPTTPQGTPPDSTLRKRLEVIKEDSVYSELTEYSFEDDGDAASCTSSGTSLGSSSDDFDLDDEKRRNEKLPSSPERVKTERRSRLEWPRFLSLFARLYEAHLFLG